MYPQENERRAVLDLDGMWKFRLDDGEGEEEKWQEQFPREHELLCVPASYNDLREDPAYRSHCGKAWYERWATVPAFFAGQRLVLRFDAVTHDAVVYLNGRELTRHRGGFLPFEAEITELVTPGVPFRITVCCDNTISHTTLPAGNEQTPFFGSDNAEVPAVQLAKAHRPKANFPNFDFFNYAGISRHVRIYTTPASYIRDIRIVPDIEGKDGIVRIQVETGGKEDQRLSPKIRILDRQGQEVAGAEGRQVLVRIPDAHLWEPYPGDPYLYRAQVTCGEDVYTEEFGVRTVRVEGTRFLINGKPFYFKGFGKHEDFYILGRGTSRALNVKDVSLLHWIHANSFRTSHYPYAEEMYRLCDHEGIVVIDEAPAVGISAGAEDPYRFPILEYHRQVLHDLVRRDGNHPCVVMWSMGNEPDTDTHPASAYDYWRDLYGYVHAEDPQNRPVTFVCCQNDYTKDLVTRTMDVVCINRYYGWYNLSGDLDSACYAWNCELDFWEKQGKPVLCTEYGCDTLPGLHGTPGEMWTEEFQREYLARIDAVFDGRPFFIGEQVWCFADFGTGQGVYRADGNRKGIFSRERRPKLAAHWLRDRWARIPNFGYKE